MSIVHAKRKLPIIEIVFNLGMIVFFFQALILPEANAQWIFRGAFLIFVFEFFAIFGVVVPLSIMKDVKKELRKGKKFKAAKEIFGGVFSIVILLVLVFVFGALAGNPYFVIFFFVSSATKLISHAGVGIDKREIVVSTILMVLTPVIATVTASFWVALFPFSEEVLSQKLEGSSGTFVDQPQVLLGWGIIYFTLQLLYTLNAEKVNKHIKDENIKF